MKALTRHDRSLGSGVTSVFPDQGRGWLIVILFTLLTSVVTPVIADEGKTISRLPDSLAQWYKPVNKRQVWLHTMFALRRERQAIEEYVELKNPELVRKWSERFVKHLRQLPEMAPEWEDEVELKEALRLERAALSGDLEAVSKAIARISRNCRSCHREYRALAAMRFRSPDFSQIPVSDDQGGEISYAQLMSELSRAINRIKIASEDQRWKHANQASARLRVLLRRLGESCIACHKDPPPHERILGSASQGVLDGLDEVLQKRQAELSGKKLGEAAVIICARCHGVHRTLNDVRSLLY
ncbi:MAG: cytochrome c [Candidatus Thiodiazotropha sp. (ex Dulcina madagascariensis)]|nr:cytochrome c [Candidatus Thiodiazotropha sp. (ex Dulcina madagascariensis)]MCU7928962.1 cytochrome c [Candidatus Thiodiazotropha sp. (ex Dulcina madagascariensis)]